jgi:hypothetical protein
MPLLGSTTIPVGVLSGNAPIYIHEIASEEMWGSQVDIAWMCGNGGQPRIYPQGYQFRLNQIGCMGNQKLTLRYTPGSHRVSIEQYGNPNYQLTQPTKTTPAGEEFEFKSSALWVKGAILAANEAAATIRVDAIQVNDMPICSTGTFTFLAE